MYHLLKHTCTFLANIIYHVLSCPDPILSCPVTSCPVLWYPVLSCPVLYRPVMSWSLLVGFKFGMHTRFNTTMYTRYPAGISTLNQRWYAMLIRNVESKLDYDLDLQMESTLNCQRCWHVNISTVNHHCFSMLFQRLDFSCETLLNFQRSCNVNISTLYHLKLTAHAKIQFMLAGIL
jgi:hypothetical protein